MPTLLLLASLAADPVPPDPIARMATLYDEVCLRTFPIDGEVDALMARKGAKPMTPAEAKVTLRDDPGRGWFVEDGDRPITVFLELPPYHACSVRRMIPDGSLDLAPYRKVADAYTARHRGFVSIDPLEHDIGELHMQAIGDQRLLSGGSAESLLVIDQHISDAGRRAKGETAISLRFVHQIKGPQ